MITTKIKMSQIKDKNIFSGAKWTEATKEQQDKVFLALSIIKENSAALLNNYI